MQSQEFFSLRPDHENKTSAPRENLRRDSFFPLPAAFVKMNDPMSLTGEREVWLDVTGSNTFWTAIVPLGEPR